MDSGAFQVGGSRDGGGRRRRGSGGWNRRLLRRDRRRLSHALLELVQPEVDIADKAVEAIQRAASTGQIGDGKIFVFDIKQAIRIRTGESGAEAL